MQTTSMEPRTCVTCFNEFTPKPGGWNAKYCSKYCKIRKRPAKESRAGEETYYSRFVKNNPERLAAHNERARQNQSALRKWLADYKVGRGCADCGYNEHPAALQFDHTGPKTATISEIRSSKKRILAEIEAGKCVVRCANCHSVKTWERKVGIA